MTGKNQRYHNTSNATSIGIDIKELPKSKSRYLLFGSFLSNNKVSFEGNYTGKYTDAQFKSKLKLIGKLSSLNTSFMDRTKLSFKLKERRFLELLIKKDIYKFHLDFGNHLIKTNLNQYRLDTWNNPYLILSCTSKLKDFNLTIGNIKAMDNNYSIEHGRIVIKKENDKIKADLFSNTKLFFDRFTFACLFETPLLNFFSIKKGKLSLEYDLDNLNFVVEMDKKEQHKNRFYFDQFDFGTTYKVNDQYSFGFWATKTNTIQDKLFSLAFENRINESTRLKTRIDSNLDVEIYAGYKFFDNLNLHLSMMTSINKKRTEREYNNGANFGVKLRYDN